MDIIKMTNCLSMHSLKDKICAGWVAPDAEKDCGVCERNAVFCAGWVAPNAGKPRAVAGRGRDFMRVAKTILAGLPERRAPFELKIVKGDISQMIHPSTGRSALNATSKPVLVGTIVPANTYQEHLLGDTQVSNSIQGKEVKYV